ncbi:MAG TPA: hypothetical protein PK375_01970 [Rhodocyclaceae bacterium]|nr:hypothetical protein [Rhodocyclaceae bacterium]HNH34648.1 hypothetical protein [Rhodocyclaceae bacterium]
MRKTVTGILCAMAMATSWAQPAGGRGEASGQGSMQGMEAPAIGKMGPGMAGGSGPHHPRQTDCRANPDACAAVEKARQACRELKQPERRQCLKEHRKAR